MHSLRKLSPYGQRKREESKLWFKSQEYKRIISQWKKEINAAQKKDDRKRQLKYTSLLAETYFSLELYDHVIDYSKRCIDIAKAVGDRPSELKACYLLVKTYDVLKKYDTDARYYSEKCIELADEINEKKCYLKACYLLIKAYGSLNQYDCVVVYAKKYLQCAKKTSDEESELKAYYALIAACDLFGQYDANTVSYCQRCIDITGKTGDKKIKLKAFLLLIKTYEYLHQCDEVAIAYCKNCLDILKGTDNMSSEMKAFDFLVKAYGLLKKYNDAIPYIKRYIEIAENISHTHGKLKGYYLLGLACNFIGKHEDAITYSKKSGDIAKEIGDHQYQMKNCLQLAKAFFSKKNYDEAIVYCIECIDIAKQEGDRSHEMDASLLLSNVYFLKEQYEEVIDSCNKCVRIANQTNDQRGLTNSHLLLGKVYYSQNKFHEATAHCRKCIRLEQFASKQDEIDAYSKLVETQCRLENYNNAITYGESCIRRAYETNQQHALTNVYYFLGKACYSLNRNDDAVNFFDKYIDIAKQNGDQTREIEVRLLLADVFYERKRYGDAVFQSKECIRQANQMGNKKCEIMEAYLLVGKSYFSLKCYKDASSNVKKCIKMAKETGYLKLELDACIFNARLSLSTGNIKDLVSAIAQALILSEELHDGPAKQAVIEITFAFLEQHDEENSVSENCEPEAYQTLENDVGNMGQETEIMKKIEQLFVLHKRYTQQVRHGQCVEAIATLKQIAEIDLSPMKVFLESFCHQRIGCLYLELHQSEEAIFLLCTAMDYAKEVGSAVIENNIIFKCSRILGVAYFKNGETKTSICFLRESINCIDFLVKNMEADENNIIDFIDRVNDCYNYLAKGLIKEKRVQEALLVLEQRTARALKQQLITRHEIERQERCEEHLTYHDIESLVSSNNYSILFCSVFPDCLYTFLVERDSDVQFGQYPGPKTDIERSIKTLHETFAVNNNRTLSDKEESAIDQNLSKAVGRILAYFGSSSCSRTTTKEPCENIDVESITNDLEVLYHKLFGEMSIAQDEIVVIPDGPLYKVPFAALRNPDTGQYLSETKRIRIAPSITTLKLLQEIPVDQSKNPALVVGDPLVGEVMLDGKKKKVRPLSAAFREANAVSSICNVMPLTGQMATKPAVMKGIQREVSLVHIAAHGCFANGTIPLAPPPEIRKAKIPDQEDYMLTTEDVQQTKVRAPLVVLSCCETGLGEIKAEGVVGMCRAFLASGASAVVASRWAIHDQATYKFMEMFYQHLETGESASTSLHHTMKEMRTIQEYSDPKYWAPFFLMGDDMTISL